MSVAKRDNGPIDNKEAVRLLKVGKVAIDETRHSLSERSFTIELRSEDGCDQFQLDYNHGSITLRYKIQCRVSSKFPLLRLDVGGPFHNNPDARIECTPDDPFYDIHESCIGRHFKIGEPHIHYYREGFDDSWAYPVTDLFTDIENEYITFEEYMRFCNVVKKPWIEGM